MQLLLDTHALLWWLEGSEAMPQHVRDAIDDRTGLIFVSAASAWEIATKHRVGKLPAAAPLVGRLGEVVALQKFRELPISFAHAELAGQLPGEHRDPFDRMLVAQALAEKLILVSNERIFDGFGVARLW